MAKMLFPKGGRYRGVPQFSAWEWKITPMHARFPGAFLEIEAGGCPTYRWPRAQQFTPSH